LIVRLGLVGLIDLIDLIGLVRISQVDLINQGIEFQGIEFQGAVGLESGAGFVVGLLVTEVLLLVTLC
jgi:hypothetical protein